MAVYEFRWVGGSEPIMIDLRAFRHRQLYQPFGVPSARIEWNDTQPGVTHLVALRDDEIVGYGRLEKRGSEAQIRHLCVGEGERGNGLGGQLIDLLVSRAKEQGAGQVFLNARFTSQGLYRNRGFKEVGELFQSENTLLPHRRMERAI